MADKSNNQQTGSETQEEVLVAAADPDASNYVLQPTAHELPAFLGNPPKDRFTEEVHKESDERVGKALGEAHPEENRAPMGIGPDTDVNDLPDTTGRAAHRRRTS